MAHGRKSEPLVSSAIVCSTMFLKSWLLVCLPKWRYTGKACFCRWHCITWAQNDVAIPQANRWARNFRWCNGLIVHQNLHTSLMVNPPPPSPFFLFLGVIFFSSFLIYTHGITGKQTLVGKQAARIFTSASRWLFKHTPAAATCSNFSAKHCHTVQQQ